ncbi:MAG: hypothetical protein JWM36_3201 [Hyphomicrobiales bacterium]|nr:hypothetical protein [Hyphomicrobiales bacterium]
MKVRDPDTTPIGPWHSWRVGFWPKRTYDGRWLFYGVVERRRVMFAAYTVEENLCFPARDVLERKGWQFADLDQVLSSAP